MKLKLLLLVLTLLPGSFLHAQKLETKPPGTYFAPLFPLAAPATRKPVLHTGDRLAICGDSITEQRRYSRIMETYLTVAHPELQLSVRQFGWSGEKAPGFLARLTNDVLRFHPTVATTCYGMNDQLYRPYNESIGSVYRSNMVQIVEDFKGAGTRVVIGSSGCMGLHNPPWKFVTGTSQERNINLCMLRNIDIQIAHKEHEGFADLFWPMYKAQFEALNEWGTNYALAGKDNVHPGMAGSLVMAYAFLKGLDTPGDIGCLTVNLKTLHAHSSIGHEVVSSTDNSVTFRSTRYPFCATGATNDDNSIRSGMALVPFNSTFNRFMLVATHANAQHYRVTWGTAAKDYSAKELKAGVNLAADFPINPFSSAFDQVDQAVAKKQEYETTQIKSLFRSDAAKADMEKTAANSEQDRAKLVETIQTAFVPVIHILTFTPE